MIARSLVALALLAACAHAPPPPSSDGARVHVVQPGDTPIAIARKHGVAVDALMQVNAIDDPTKLKVGQRLVLPVGAATSPAPAVLGDGAGADHDSLPPAAPPPPSLSASPLPSPSRTTAPASPPVASAPPASPPPAKPVVAPSALPAIMSPPPPSDLAAMRSTFTPSPKTGQAKLIWPVEGVVVSLFGPREGQRHDGIDIGAPSGTAIWAAADGVVVFAGEQPGYGLLVILDHEGDLATIYAHNAANLVVKGDRVKQGDPVAQVGQTGGAAAPAVHFEIRQATTAVNPLGLLPE